MHSDLDDILREQSRQEELWLREYVSWDLPCVAEWRTGLHPGFSPHRLYKEPWSRTMQNALAWMLSELLMDGAVKPM